MEKKLNSEHFPLNIFPAIYDNCHLLIYFTLEANIASTLNPDQTAPLGAVWSGLIGSKVV